MDLLDWLDSRPSYAPPKARRMTAVPVTEDDEDQLDLVELIAGLDRAA